MDRLSYPCVHPQSGQQTLIIDRGARDGVLSGAPVVTGEGLVGVVERADRDSAIVRMLIAPRVAVSAKAPAPSYSANDSGFTNSGFSSLSDLI
jgi:cell shape-determining protein MreC